MMLVFIASYYLYTGCGDFDSYECVVVANTQEEALGLLLEKYARTSARDWTIELLDTDIVAVHELADTSRNS